MRRLELLEVPTSTTWPALGGTTSPARPTPQTGRRWTAPGTTTESAATAGTTTESAAPAGTAPTGGSTTGTRATHPRARTASGPAPGARRPRGGTPTGGRRDGAAVGPGGPGGRRDGPARRAHGRTDSGSRWRTRGGSRRRCSEVRSGRRGRRRDSRRCGTSRGRSRARGGCGSRAWGGRRHRDLAGGTARDEPLAVRRRDDRGRSPGGRARRGGLGRRRGRRRGLGRGRPRGIGARGRGRVVGDPSGPGARSSSRLLLGGLLGRDGATKSLAVGLPADAVGLGILDRGRVALHPDAQRQAEVEGLLVR